MALHVCLPIAQIPCSLLRHPSSNLPEKHRFIAIDNTVNGSCILTAFLRIRQTGKGIKCHENKIIGLFGQAPKSQNRLTSGEYSYFIVSQTLVCLQNPWGPCENTDG